MDALASQPAIGPDIVTAVATALGLRYAGLTELAGWTADFSRLTYAQARRRTCVVARDGDGQTCAVIADPFDDDLWAWLHWQFPDHLIILTHRDEFTAWLDQCEERMSALPQQSARAIDLTVSGSDAEVLSLERIRGDESLVVRFVNSTLYDGLKAGASDIHLECDARGLVVKFRLDGVLSEVGHLDGVSSATQVLSRVKVMAELDIAERRIPQDGRLQVRRGDRAIDVRVSIMPSIHGEDAVLRILDRQSLTRDVANLSLATLGLPSSLAQSVLRLATRSHGLLLVTGPTGSGKTTTLYAALTDTHETRDKTITIEDPVEYQLPGVLQIPVNEKKGLTFAVGLRSILRHDPDRILVGEIRDAETAQIAVQAALTGHLVFTTVHANSVFDVFGRFTQFGIDPYAFVSALNGVLAQRLMRRLCPHCAVSFEPPPGELDAAGVPLAVRSGAQWRRAVGCAHCRNSGYRGRFAIGELLHLTPVLRSLIAERAALSVIDEQARLGGFVALHAQAVEAAALGETTLDEVQRVASA